MSNDNESETASPASQSLGLRIQKKIASKMSNKNVAKIFIDDTTGRILDNIYSLVKQYTGNKKLAESFLNDIIKIIVKVGLLVKNNQLSPSEVTLCNNFRETFHVFVKSALSFYEIHYTYEYKHLNEILSNCHLSIQTLVKNHLTDKSKQRIDNVFTFFSNRQFMEECFRNDNYRPVMNKIVEDVRKLVDEGSL